MRPPARNRLTPEAAAPRPPLDVFDAAVRLETEGVTDAVARSDYGFASTLDLAELTYQHQEDAPDADPPPRLKHWLASYVHGVSFAVPVLLCALSMYWLGYSLWGGNVASDVASAVAVGTVSSFLVTGGFVQGMARRALFFLTTDAVPRAACTCRRWIVAGAASLGITAVAGLALNSYFGWMPPALASKAAAFHVSLGLLWLGCGLLYVLDWNLTLGVAVAAGLGFVGLTHQGLGWERIGAQVGGILLAAAVALAAGVLVFRRRLGGRDTAGEAPSLVQTAYLAGPYFLYGILYYLFLFMDRILAWTAGTNAETLPLFFRGDYEVSLDLALVAFVIQVGFVHPSLVAFRGYVERRQRVTPITGRDQFNREVLRFYRRRSLWFSLWLAVSAVAVAQLGSQSGILASSLLREVAFLALAGYALLVFALWNVSILFSLSVAQPGLAGMAAALPVNLMVGYILSRIWSYDLAVVGFVAGSAVFAAVSTAGVVRRLRSLDYYHFIAAI